MRGVMVLLVFAVGLTGCQSTPKPATDPFSLHPLVPPPATGAGTRTSADPGYSPSSTTRPSAGTSLPTGTAGAGWVPPNSSIPPAATPNATPAATGAAPNYGAGNTNVPNYGAGNAPATPGVPPPLGYPAAGASPSTIIPPPATSNTSGMAAPGNYPASSASPSTMPGLGTTPAPTDRYGIPNGANNLRGTSNYPTAPIAGTPRPTATQGANLPSRPAMSIPSSSAYDPRNANAAATTQPIRSPYVSNANVPLNPTNNLASPPRSMPIPPTAYPGPLAAPPYVATIQTIEPDWQPCDGYADDGE